MCGCDLGDGIIEPVKIMQTVKVGYGDDRERVLFGVFFFLYRSERRK